MPMQYAMQVQWTTYNKISMESAPLEHADTLIDDKRQIGTPGQVDR